jgi:hypothetical protein
MSRSASSVAVSTRTDQLFEAYVRAKSKADSSSDRADGVVAGQTWREFVESFSSERRSARSRAPR